MQQTIQSMLEIQDTLNKLTIGPCWREKALDWPLAIFVECAEGIEHLAWKWWKKQEVNIEAAQLEVIDIHHFVLSEMLHLHTHSTIEGVAVIAHNSFKDRIISGDGIIDSFKRLGGDASLDIVSIGAVFALGEQLRMTPHYQYKLYCAKAILNTFRQKNGYKEGTYIKVWEQSPTIIDGVPLFYVEDNDFLQNAIKTIDFSIPGAPDLLYALLEARYKEVVQSFNTLQRS